MFTLRSNQEEPINKAIAFFKAKSPKPSLIVLPTAWGKSILTAYVAKDTEDKLLVLQPSKELLEQNYKKYISLCGFFSYAGIYSASMNSKFISRVTYATIGSIKDLGPKFKALGFTKLLIDEAHLYPREADSMLGKFIAESGITHVLGITATPIKLQSNTDLDGNRFSKLQMLTSKSGKGNFYKEIIHVGQVSEMVQLGFWSPLKYWVSSKYDGSKLVYNSAKSDFTEESVMAMYQTNGLRSDIAMHLDANQDRKHVLIFVPSVADAKRFAAERPSAGVVYGEQDKRERAATIEAFRAGRIRELYNVRVLSTGFDYTGIDCIIFAIDTASIALYYQIVGRATRVDDGKNDALIIDLCGNVSRFGKVEDLHFEKVGRIWRLFGTGGVLLSGVPMHTIGEQTRETLLNPAPATAPAKETAKPSPVVLPERWPFGKYKDFKISESPEGYRLWALQNFTWSERNAGLKQSIVQTLKK